MNKIIYLESDEEIISIVDRLRSLSDKKIALVIPSGAMLFNSSMNLRLLYEESKELGKEVSLVTTDSAGRNIASGIGFTVYETLGEVRETKSRDEEERGREALSTRRLGREKKKTASEDEEIEEEDAEIDLDVDEESGYTDIKEKETEEEDEDEADDFFEEPRKKVNEKDFFIHEKEGKKKPSLKKARGILSRGPKFWAASVAAFILLLFLLVFIFPKATIYLNVYASEQKIDINFKLSAEKQQVEKAEKIILPAKWEEAEKEASVEVDATGEKNVGEKAKGLASIYNRSGKQIDLIANTELVTGDGKKFRIPAAIAVPGAFVSTFGEMVPGKTSIVIEAVEAGEAFNIRPTKLYITALVDTLGNLVYGQIDNDMTGGSNRMAKVVSKEDIEKAKTKLQEDIDNQLEKDFGTVGDTVLVKGLGTSETISEDFSKKENEEAEKLTVTRKTKASFLTFNRKDFNNMVNDSLKMYVSDQKEVVGSGYRSVEWQVVSFDGKKKEGEVTAKAVVLTATRINQDTLKAGITSLSVQELRTFLAKYPDVELDRARFFPPLLLNSIPSNERNINIVIQHPER